MASTLEERVTIHRLRHLHDLQPKQIHGLFDHIPYSSIKRITSKFDPRKGKPDPIPPQDTPKEKTKLDKKDNEIVFEQTTSNPNRIQNLDQLVEAYNIDLKVWKIERWTANTWESAMRGDDGKPIITTLFQVRAHFKPHQQGLVDTLLSAVREELKGGIPPYKPFKLKKKKKHHHIHARMFEVSIPDMHFGKLALEEETGQQYDIEIAEKIYRTAVQSIMELANGPIDRILLPIGNDLFNVDNAFLTTYANTPQENTHSIKQLYRKVKNILRDTIIDLSRIAPVDVIVIPGNHDKTLTYFLGESIEDMFAFDQRVQVNNSSTNTKYYQWGKVLLGFAHGQIEKPAQLPLIMATDVPNKWAATQFREWHLGHFHRKKDQVYMPLSNNNGVHIRVLPSLTAADNWHKDHGYHMGPRSAEGYLWDSETGLVATYNHNLLN